MVIEDKVLNIIKRGEALKGVMYKEAKGGEKPYYGEVYYKGTIYTSARYSDEDYVEQWIDNKFNSILGEKRWYI